MMIGWYLLGALSGVLTMLVLIALERRFRKPTIDRYHATLEAAPGKSALTLTHEGEPVVEVILSSVQRDMNGSSAQFEDYTHFMDDRRMW